MNLHWSSKTTDDIINTKDVKKQKIILPFERIASIACIYCHYCFLLTFLLTYSSPSLPIFSFSFFFHLFLTAICLPHSQLWAIIKGGASLTHLMLITMFCIDMKVTRSGVTFLLFIISFCFPQTETVRNIVFNNVVSTANYMLFLAKKWP